MNEYQSLNISLKSYNPASSKALKYSFFLPNGYLSLQSVQFPPSLPQTFTLYSHKSSHLTKTYRDLLEYSHRVWEAGGWEMAESPLRRQYNEPTMMFSPDIIITKKEKNEKTK